MIVINNNITKNYYNLIYKMGSKSNKSVATENMKQIKELDINEKTKTDILLFNTLKDCINRIEKLEETKSDKIYYRLPPVNLCNYSLI